jgi:hypothetical protein
MIEFKRKGKTVTCEVGGQHPVAGWHVTFSAVQAGEFYALLVHNNLENALENRLRAIREQAYRQGVEDGRGKKRRLKNFSSGWNPRNIGW